MALLLYFCATNIVDKFSYIKLGSRPTYLRVHVHVEEIYCEINIADNLSKETDVSAKHIFNIQYFPLHLRHTTVHDNKVSCAKYYKLAV